MYQQQFSTWKTRQNNRPRDYMTSQVTVWWKFARFEQSCQHSAAAVILSHEWQPLWEEILIRTFRALCSNTSSPVWGPFQHRCLKLGERQKMHKVALAKVGGWPLQVPLVPWAEGSQQGKRAMSMMKSLSLRESFGEKFGGLWSTTTTCDHLWRWKFAIFCQH